jgi:hypothetical protein
MRLINIVATLLRIWRDWLAIRRENRARSWERRNRRIPVQTRRSFGVTPSDSISTLRRIDHAPRR